MTESHAQREIGAAIDAQALELAGGPAVLTGWVLVSEWANDASEAWLSKLGAHGQPDWRADGLLFHGLMRFEEAE